MNTRKRCSVRVWVDCWGRDSAGDGRIGLAVSFCARYVVGLYSDGN